MRSRIASETMQYCIATTVSLFDAVASQLNGETASVAAFRERILTTDGVLEA